MSQFDKAWEKFNRVPIPKDITFEDIKYIAEHFGFEIVHDGKHGIKVRYRPLNIKIPIPIHGKTIGVAYIAEIKKAINRISD